MQGPGLIRLKVKQNGATLGYVEAIDFVGLQAVVSGPNVVVTGASSGGGGGDADTLQGHPASFFAPQFELDAVETRVSDLEVSVSTITDRAQSWAALGVAIQGTPPDIGITYAEWLAGASGYWAWIWTP